MPVNGSRPRSAPVEDQPSSAPVVCRDAAVVRRSREAVRSAVVVSAGGRKKAAIRQPGRREARWHLAGHRPRLTPRGTRRRCRRAMLSSQAKTAPARHEAIRRAPWWRAVQADQRVEGVPAAPTPRSPKSPAFSRPARPPTTCRHRAFARPRPRQPAPAAAAVAACGSKNRAGGRRRCAAASDQFRRGRAPPLPSAGSAGGRRPRVVISPCDRTGHGKSARGQPTAGRRAVRSGGEVAAADQPGPRDRADAGGKKNASQWWPPAVSTAAPRG